MSHLTAPAKVSNFLEDHFIELLHDWRDDLFKHGDLLSVENTVFDLSQRIFEQIMTTVLEAAAALFCQQQAASQTGLALRYQNITIRTGHLVKVDSLYRKRVDDDHQGSRHPLAKHWGLIGSSSPLRYSLLTYATMVAPSYDMAQQLLSQFNVPAS